MSFKHPAARRAWVQTGGRLVEPLHADLRAEFDQVDNVQWIGGGCFKLFDLDGRQIGIVQFQGEAQTRVDTDVEGTLLRLAESKPKPANLANGDTVIRTLDLSNPDDADIFRKVREAGGAIVSPAERVELPPLDMPDYDGDGRKVPDPVALPDAADRQRFPWHFSLFVVLVVALVVLAAILSGSR